MIDLLKIWIEEGIFHIIDPTALDHLLYVVALAVPFILNKPRQLLILITAFTVGHTLSLGISATITPVLPKIYIEIGILSSVIFTVLLGIRYQDKSPSFLQYLITVVIGCIHGLGFGSEFAMMHQQKGWEFVTSLFGFNLGVEVGQIIIIAASYCVVFGLTKIGVTNRWLLYIINSGIVFYTLYLLIALISN
jgi:hypothetical protein